MTRDPFRAVILVLLLSLPGWAGAAMPGTQSVSVTAVNYTDRHLDRYEFVDPDDKRNAAGGEWLMPFGVAAPTCCYALPATWHPGTQVTLEYRFLNDDRKEEVKRIATLAVPKYPPGHAGRLWALLHPDGSAEVIASELTPGHARWPGKIKAWPKATVEYVEAFRHRKVREFDERAAKLRASMDPTPSALKADWKSYQDLVGTEGEELRRLSGPDDPRFKAFRKKRIEKELEMLRMLSDSMRAARVEEMRLLATPPRRSDMEPAP